MHNITMIIRFTKLRDASRNSIHQIMPEIINLKYDYLEYKYRKN